MLTVNMAAFDWSSFFLGAVAMVGLLLVITGIAAAKKKSG